MAGRRRGRYSPEYKERIVELVTRRRFKTHMEPPHRRLGDGAPDAGRTGSMGSVGDAYDNAMCESFFATLECELLERRKFPTVAGARREVFSFIEGFYSTRRLHSALGYESPVNFEKLNHAA